MHLFSANTDNYYNIKQNKIQICRLLDIKVNPFSNPIGFKLTKFIETHDSIDFHQKQYIVSL